MFGQGTVKTGPQGAVGAAQVLSPRSSLAGVEHPMDQEARLVPQLPDTNCAAYDDSV